ncbi:MAG TPA: hypothetical protein VFA10_17120, partial [Ktedonobacteraceae bacterium]|nr:hypothetical protein [Ktedonobacteraceae bacterium]
YYIELKSFLKFVQEVIDDDIASTYYNPETGTYKRTRKMVLPPMPDGVKKLLEEHPDPMLREMLAGMYDIGTSS